MKLIVDFLYLVAVTAISPMVLYRMVRHKRYRAGWAQKLGDITRKQPGKKCIWIHAVSVGEVNATKTIIAGLKEKFSDFEIVISTTTDTGYARAKALYGSQFTVFYFPYDFSSISRRAFDNIRPAICLLMELEVWPNFVATAKKLNVPVVVVNCRISEKSYSRYR
ncbi:MAG: 3-deoxy-D-manno-octulosonic acid transferase, partial [Planctomycetota bacterium]